MVSSLSLGAAAATSAEGKAKEWWTDDKGLIWTTKDNGSGGLDWHEAVYRCRILETGGWND